MTDDELISLYASYPRTIAAHDLPAMPPAWMHPEHEGMARLQAALLQNAPHITQVYLPVPRTKIHPGQAPHYTPVWDSHDAKITGATTDAPPVLEITPGSWQAAITDWLGRTHTGQQAATRWLFVQSQVGSYAVLFLDSRPDADADPVRVHLCFNLWVEREAALVKQIDTTGRVNLTLAALKRAHPDQGMQLYRSVQIAITSPFHEVLCDDDPTADADARWQEAIKAYPQISVQSTPLLPIIPSVKSTHTMGMIAGEVRGLGRVVLGVSSAHHHEESSATPNAALVRYMRWTEAESRVRNMIEETAGRVRSGWHSISITCAKGTPTGWAFCWELCVQYRQQKHEPLQQTIQRVIRACLDTDMDELPAFHWPHLWALYRDGATAERLTDTLELLSVREDAMSLALIGWHELHMEFTRRSANGNLDAPSTDEEIPYDRAARSIMQVIHEIIHSSPIPGGLTDLLRFKRQDAAFLKMLISLDPLFWTSEQALPAVDRMIGSLSDKDDLYWATVGTGALACLLHPAIRLEQLHHSAFQVAGRERPIVRRHTAAQWRWFQTITLTCQSYPEEQYQRPPLPAEVQAWLFHPNPYAPIWSPTSTLHVHSVSTAVRMRNQALLNDLQHRAALGTRPVVGYYRVKIPPAGFPLLEQTEITELRIWMDGGGSGWFAFGPDDAAGVILPIIWQMEPPAPWRMLITEPLAWELQLILAAWYADMRSAGVRAVMGTDTPIREHRPAAPRRKERDRIGPSTLYAPRMQRQRPEPDSVPVISGPYADAEDRAEIARRVLAAHGVRAHVWKRAGAIHRKRALQQRAWQQLDAATRIQILFGAQDDSSVTDLSYPAEGQIRGMQVTEEEDGTLRVELGYARGGRRDADAPIARPVVCAGLHAVMALLAMPEPAETPQAHELTA